MRRAAAAALVSSTPGSVVIHDDDDTGELVLHVIVGNQTALQDAVQR
jgi:multisubunit Na+/H+ antiporter MnhE subunit